jgi:hypothetical protein
MKKLSVALCAVAFLLLAITGMVRAEVVLFEDFEDASGFTIGNGDVGAGYWGPADINGTQTFPSEFQQGDSSQSGTIFYGAAARAYMGAPAATVTIPLPDLSGYTNLTLTVALAANDQYPWENSHRDSLHIIGGTTIDPPEVPCDNLAGCMPIAGAIDSFLPYPRPGNLRSQVYNPVVLHRQFEDFEYAIDSSLKSITFAFASTGGDEVVGIDSVTITGDPIVIPVSIDIKPGSQPNSINPKSNGKIPIAILSTEEFDALQMVNKDSLTFGRTGDEDSLAFCNYRGEDINGDGLKDLVCHFYTEDTGFLCGDTEGVLKGMTMDGTPIEGKDSVKIVPCK